MKSRGVKVLDPVFQTRQLDWLTVSARRCRDESAERRVISARFRVAHEPWGASRAYVRPVEIRRSRRRILFVQESGISL
jgi:hypothetical protein